MRRSLKKKRNELEFQVLKEFIKHLLTLESNKEIDLFFFDESCFTLLPSIPYGWQPIGKTIGLESQRSKNLNILGFININNELHPYRSEGSVTSEVVIGCFEDFIKNRKSDIPLFIVTDNAPTHRSNKFVNKVAEWQEKDCFIIYLPPYSPELNIIEVLWRFIKYKWIEVGAYKSFEKLKTNVENILKCVGSEYRINFQNEKKCQEIYA